ncbi:50S ribosomal protein L1 [Candidatus Woesearchaeota archaeon]|nr:50S ribosomal protein L1 [Candidatus Woesearchaeota archaeon]|tara:strand:- start:359 stop:1165 length:807 start_codon:yes stop_codon:yes gene_type:complete
MDKALIAKTLKTVKENSPKRNFKQSIDLIINLKDIDLKKAEQQVNMFITLHNDVGKKISVCAFVGTELEKNAKEVCEEVILADQFAKFKDKKELKKLANKHNYFISQANIMPKVATAFGRFLGPRGKMPNPKLGSVLPPNANVKPLYEKLKKTVNLTTKNEPAIKCIVGKEDNTDEQLIDNILTVYNSLIQKLPNEKHNIKSIMLKLTMGPSFKVGEEPKKETDKAKKPEAKKKEPAKETKKEPIKQEEPEKQNQSKEQTPKEKPNQK